MSNSKNAFLIPTHLYLILFFSIFTFACNKDVKTKTDSIKHVERLSPSITSGPGQNCNEFTPLTLNSDGSYTGYVENVQVKVSGIIYQQYDQNGNPITFQQGDPFMAQIESMSGSANILYNTTSQSDDQFSIRIWQMGAYVLDMTRYENDMQQWLSSNNNPTSLNSLNSPTTKPDITNYFVSSGGVSYHDVAGRFIRINPTQVGIDANGQPIMTTFALAASCYPRNNLGTSTITGQATIRLRNTYSAPGNSPSIQVDLIQNNTIKATINYPTTYNGYSSTVSFPAGSYILKYTIPAPYANNFYSWLLGPIGDNSQNYWDVTTNPGTVNSDGSRSIVTGLFSFYGNTAYTLNCSNIAD